MKNLIIIFLSSIAFVTMSFAPAITTYSFDFKILEGNDWTGHLTYLNYSDNSSTATLNCKMNALFEKGKLVTTIPFEEIGKNGKPYIHDYSYQIKEDLLKGGKWKIIEQRKEDDKTIIVAMSKGKDNSKAADFRLTLTMSKNFFSRQKETRYKGTDTFFTRHTYTFTR